MNNHPSSGVSLNAVFYVKGMIGTSPTKFLLDTGAAMSALCWDILPEGYQNQMESVHSKAVGANGLPLEVVGQVTVAISVGGFTCEQRFVVVRNPTVDCVLGADFLSDQAAIIDCRGGTLSLAEGRCNIPIDTEIARQATEEVRVGLTVVAAIDIEIPGGTIQLATGCVKGNTNGVSEGLFEPKYDSKLPKHISAARSLGRIVSGDQVVLQVMNTSPSPTKVYKGTILGTFIPNKLLLVLDKGEPDNKDAHIAPVPVFPDIETTCKHLSHQQKIQLTNLLVKYQDLFISKADPLGHTDKVKHSIQTERPPIRQPIRRLPEALKRTVDVETKQMLDEGVIRTSSSPWSSPVVMVRKKDGSWRFCIDYRKLNSITHRDAYPLPRIDSTLDTLSGLKYFTTLDLASGYWQVEINESDKEKTAFSTRQGHFEFNVMPFELTNAPATFQRLMECILAGLNMEQCLIYYIDDIIIFGSSVDEHLQRLDNVLSRIRAAGLKLQTKKCCFVQEQVHYLGHIVSANGIQPDKSKIQAVSAYPVPQDTKQLRQFLGLTNYYCRFVENYSKIA